MTGAPCATCAAIAETGLPFLTCIDHPPACTYPGCDPQTGLHWTDVWDERGSIESPTPCPIGATT